MKSYYIFNDVSGNGETEDLVVVLMVIKEEQSEREEAVQVRGEVRVCHTTHTPDQ